MSRKRTSDIASRQFAPKPFVLVVDDEKSIANTLVLILQSRAYRAEAAYDGSSALQASRKNPPDLIITDVLMPGMNGIDLAITIRHELPTCRLLLFSGQAASADMLEEARGRGYDFELLAKPIDPEELLAKVRDLIGSAHEHSASPAPSDN